MWCVVVNPFRMFWPHRWTLVGLCLCGLPPKNHVIAMAVYISVSANGSQRVMSASLWLLTCRRTPGGTDHHPKYLQLCVGAPTVQVIWLTREEKTLNFLYANGLLRWLQQNLVLFSACCVPREKRLVNTYETLKHKRLVFTFFPLP